LPIVENYAAKRESQITTRTLSDAADAFMVASAEALDMDHDISLNERGEAYLGNFEPFVKSIVDRANERAEGLLKQKGWKSPSEVEQAIEAGIKARQVEAQNGKSPIKRPDGTSSTTDRSHEATIARIAAGTFDNTDEQYYRDYRSKRRI
jgi:hypothetical protein